MSRSKSMSRKYASAKERADKHAAGFQAPYLKLPEGQLLFRPKSGVMLLDILPYEVGKNNPWAEEGMLYYERTFWVHRGIGANNDSHLCLARNFKEACPVCEYRKRLMKKADEDDEDLIKDLSPRERQLFNIRHLKEPDKRYIWDISHHLFGKTLDATLRSADEDDDWDNFAHLEGGSTLKVSFAEESAGGRSFLTAETIYFKPRKTDYDEDVLDEVACLDKVLVGMDYDELKELFLETVEEDDEGRGAKRKRKEEDDDDDDEPKGRRRSRNGDDDDDEPKSRKRKDDDDDDDEPKSRRRSDDDDDDEPKSRKRKEDDDDDDEPKSRRSRKSDDDDDDDEPKGKKKSDDDDDWDDFDKERGKKSKDDDDDDEPKGRRRSKEDEDDDEDKPKKKNRFAPDDDEGRPRVRAGKEDDDDDDEDKPRRKRKKAEDDD